jgi:hypothetical protein
MNNAPTQQSATAIRKMYHAWRKENGNRKPNRVIVKMHWEDGDNTEKGYQVDTIGLENMDRLNFVDNPSILWYSSSIAGLLDLRQPDNGSDFILDEVLEFYKS